MKLLESLTPCPPPLRAEADGGIYVGTTEISLDTVLACYGRGENPKEIAEGFPLLTLADIYAVITYYLWHKSKVDAYLKRRRKEAERLRLDHEPQTPASEAVLRLRERKANCS